MVRVVLLAAMFLPVAAIAQTSPREDTLSPSDQAARAEIVQQLGASLAWHAKVIELQSQIVLLQKQLDEAKNKQPPTAQAAPSVESKKE